jgi:hypothetical protein
VTDDCGPLLEDGSPDVGAAPLVAMVVAGGVADEGQDHPDPGADRDCGAAVSCDEARMEGGGLCLWESRASWATARKVWATKKTRS